MINLNLNFNKNTEQGLVSFCNKTESDDEIQLDLNLNLTESNYWYIGEENS